MAPPLVWLVTGASSGFGRALAEVLLENGDVVVATLRRPELLSELAAQYGVDRLLVLRLDVTKPSEIEAAFARTREVFGRLDVVFNNAGICMLGEVESTPENDARALFDVNFWGAANVSKAAIQFFRQVNPCGRGGLLLQVTSSSAFMPPPLVSYYTASKHALEAFTESLSQELNPLWNIRICAVEPGRFETTGVAGLIIFPPHHAYSDPVLHTSFLRGIIPQQVQQGDPRKAMQAVYKLAHSDHIPSRLPLGHDALDNVRERSRILAELADESESWSDDLKRDEV